MLDAEFVTALAKEFRGFNAQTIQVDGLNYLVTPTGDGRFEVIELPRPMRMPAPVVLGTLLGFAAYVKENRDSLKRETLHAVVTGPERVELTGPLTGEFQQRAIYAVADNCALAGGSGFTFGTYLDPEAFVIALQARFVQTPDRDAILALVGNIKDESVRQASDDGVTQTVTARAGVVMAKEVPVPNPVTLAPYRTFRDVTQPESRFVLRVRRGGEGQLPTCALFEADGSAWKLDAVKGVAAWLRVELVGTNVVVIA